MTTFTSGCHALWTAATEHSVGTFVLGLACLAVLQSALGLGRSRQWQLLPLVFGLTVLAGFLLNPLADTSSSRQLRTALTRHDILTALAIMQFLRAAGAIACNLRLLGGRRTGLWAALLGFLHALPAPMVLVAMLVWEQAWLEQAVGARPESVGYRVGLLAAAITTVPALCAMACSGRWIAVAHLFASGIIMLACMFTPWLPLPLPGMRVLVESLDGAAVVTLIVIGIGAAAVVASGFRRGPSVHRLIVPVAPRAATSGSAQRDLYEKGPTP